MSGLLRKGLIGTGIAMGSTAGGMGLVYPYAVGSRNRKIEELNDTISSLKQQIPKPEEKDYFDSSMDFLNENAYKPTWETISEQSQNPGTRKLLTALALLGLLGGGSYLLGKRSGKNDILSRFR